MYGHYPLSQPYKIATFVTGDTPDEVFAFYKDSLRYRIWEDWHVDSAVQKPYSLDITGRGRGGISAPFYYFRVKTENSGGLTHVTVERSYEHGF